MAGPKLTDKQKSKRLEICQNWQKLLDEGGVGSTREKCFWADEKLFKSDGAIRGSSPKENRYCVKENRKKKDITDGILLRGDRRGRFIPVHVMVGMWFCQRGITPPFSFPEGFPIYQAVYIKTVTDNYALYEGDAQ